MLITTEKAESKTGRKITPSLVAKKTRVASTAEKKAAVKIPATKLAVKSKIAGRKEDSPDHREEYWKELWVSHL
jgi:hypothetical protein